MEHCKMLLGNHESYWGLRLFENFYLLWDLGKCWHCKECWSCRKFWYCEKCP